MKQPFLRSAGIVAAAVAVTASAWGISTAAHHATGTLSAAVAQQQGPGNGGRNRMNEVQAKILFGLKPPLTDAQKAKFKALRDKTTADFRARRAAGETPPPDPEARKKMGEQMRAKYLAELGKILTPGQLKQYESQMAAYRKAHPPQPRPN
jgi:hypothetical protein